MSEDERVYVIGEDLEDPYGGAFGVTRGLSTEFPGRVVATPISEAAIIGVAVGMAVRGFRPVVEIMFGDFITLCADQLVNVASKLADMSAGQVSVPIVVRTPMGGGRGYGPTHSQTLDKLYLGVPGLRVVAPSVYHDSGVLLKNAVRDDHPVLFSENKLLYPAEQKTVDQGPVSVTFLPGVNGYQTAVARNYADGERPDVAIISYGGSTLIADEVMRSQAEEEIKIVTVAPSTLQPLATADILEASADAPTILILEEGPRDYGWGAEVTAVIAERRWRDLSAPIRRIGAADTIIPAARNLEREALPTAEKVTQAVHELVACTL
jgi:pyruvate/2-oxoglutarate/acetoin dehydrogenase E1 component